MPKRTIIISILIFLCSVVKADSWKQDLDSLRQLLTTEVTDKEKMSVYLKMSSLLSAVDPNEAMEYATEAKLLAEKLDDKSGIVRSMLKQCDFYSTIGEYNVSLELAYNALELAKSDDHLRASCHNRIATIHAAVDNNEETLYHNKRALYYSSQEGDSSGIMVHIHNIGRVYTDLNQYDSALYYLRAANQYELDHTGRPDPYSLSNIGNVFLELEEYDSALHYHLKAYKFDVMDDQKYLIGLDQQFIANTYFKMNRFVEAKEYALSSIKIADELRAYDLSLDNYETLYKIYQSEGNYKKSLEYALMYSATRDTLFENGKQSLILGLETKHRFKEQEEKMQLLEKQRKLYLILALVSAMFLLSMIVLVILIARRQQVYRELSHQLQLANDSKEQLLSVISHDLRGSVGSLRGAAKAILDEIDNAEEALPLLESFYPVADSTYDLLENLLTWAKYSKENIQPVIEELNIKALVDKSITHIEPIAQAKSITIINSLADNIVKADKNMVLSVLRNILSNAIKFSHPKSKVLIGEENRNGAMVISITDNGVGMEPETLDKLFTAQGGTQSSGTMGERGSGLGLMICKTFLNSQGGDIWAESTIGKGTTFFFSLPVRK